MKPNWTIAIGALLIAHVTCFAGEVELVFSYRLGGGLGVGEVVSEPMWPALLFFDDVGHPISPIFEDFEIPFDFPTTVTNTVSADNDADFQAFVERLGNGVVEILSQAAWTTDGLEFASNGSLKPDLSGYTIDHIVQISTVDMRTPGLDLNGDGVWTDWTADSVYEFYGTPIPEPTTGLLLLAGIIPALGKRKKSRAHSI